MGNVASGLQLRSTIERWCRGQERGDRSWGKSRWLARNAVNVAVQEHNVKLRAPVDSSLSTHPTGLPGAKVVIVRFHETRRRSRKKIIINSSLHSNSSTSATTKILHHHGVVVVC